MSCRFFAFGQLVERFSVEEAWARDHWRSTSRLNLKLLAHTICRWLKRHSSNPLQFEQLVTQ